MGIDGLRLYTHWRSVQSDLIRKTIAPGILHCTEDSSSEPMLAFGLRRFVVGAATESDVEGLLATPTASFEKGSHVYRKGVLPL
jgi:hypothetical protein